MTIYNGHSEAPVLKYQLGINSARLPRELLNIINEYVVGGRPDASDFMGTVPAHLCRVNSTWYKIFKPMLYASYQYDGDINKLGSLWCFIRTLVQRQNLATLVRELTLTTRSTHMHLGDEERDLAFELLNQHKDAFRKYCEDYPIRDGNGYIPHDMTFDWFSEARPSLPHSFEIVDVEYEDSDEESDEDSDEDSYQHPYPITESFLHEWYVFAHYEHHRRWIDPVLKIFTEENAKCAEMMLRKKSEFHTCNRNSLSFGDFQMPLTAIIVALCPQVVRLNIDTWTQDPFLEEVMGMAIGQRPLLRIDRPLQNVERIRVGDSHSPVSDPADPANPATISNYKSYWYLPKLKDLMMLNAEMCTDLKNQAPSDIEHLTIQSRDFLQSHLSTLFTVTSNLRHLTLGLQMDYTVRGWHPNAVVGKILPDGPLQYLRIWQMIYHLKDTLCFLELYQPKHDFNLPPNENLPVFATEEDVWNGDHLPYFCPPLSEFKKLRHLNITVLGLHGHNCEHKEGTKLGNHLPPKLESLGIYANGGNWMSRHFCALSHELESIAVAGSAAQGGILRAITCAAVTEPTLTERMKAAACANGILYVADGLSCLFYGGLETFWARTNNAIFPRDNWVLDSFIERKDPGKVIPRGMTVHGYKGRL